MAFMLGLFTGLGLGFCAYHLLEEFFNDVRRNRIYISK